MASSSSSFRVKRDLVGGTATISGSVINRPHRTVISGSAATAGWDGDELVEILDPSSARFKTNIKNLESTTDDLAALRPVSYDVVPIGRDDPLGERSSRRDGLEAAGCIGLIAEEVATVYPHLIRTAKSATGERVVTGVDYARLTPLLLKEVVDLRRKVTELEEKFGAELARIASSVINTSTPLVVARNYAVFDDVDLITQGTTPISSNHI